MDLKPEIWISSISHLETFSAIVKDTPSRKKFFGFYDMPDNFPYMKQFRTRTPIIYFSKGKVAFKDNIVRYDASKDGDNHLNSYCNLNNDLSFLLNRSTIKSIEWHLYERESLRRFKWNWIRITCNEDILGGDFLICADGVTNTRKLFEMLNQFKEGQTISESLIDFSGSKISMLGYIGLILLIISIISDLIVHATYGTLNGNIWGSIVVIMLLLSMIPLFPSMIWYLTKMKENSKIRYHWQVSSWIFFIFVIINVIRIHFYH